MGVLDQAGQEERASLGGQEEERASLGGREEERASLVGREEEEQASLVGREEDRCQGEQASLVEEQGCQDSQ